MLRQARRDVLCEIQSVLDALRRNARFATVSQSAVISEVSLVLFTVGPRYLLPSLQVVRGYEDCLGA